MSWKRKLFSFIHGFIQKATLKNKLLQIFRRHQTNQIIRTKCLESSNIFLVHFLYVLFLQTFHYFFPQLFKYSIPFDDLQLCAAFNGWLLLWLVLYTTTKSGWETG